jgi:O-antigen ligase
MSRFKQPDRALAPLPPAQLGKAASTLYAEGRATAVTQERAAVAFEVPAPRQATPRSEESGPTKVGMLALCGLILSPYIQDLTMRVGFKPYLNFVCMIILPLAYLASGRAFEGFRSSIGKAWLGFAFFATLSVPFSYWRGDSGHLLWNFLSGCVSTFFLMGAFVTGYKQCRWLVTTNVICAVLVLINCAAFGEYNFIGRLELPGSFLIGNSNDLALVLLIFMGYFYYLVLRPSNLTRALGGGGMLACLYFILKSGSRGGFLALGVFLMVLFIFSRNKFVWVALAVPILALFLLLTPSSLIHRLTLIVWEPAVSESQSESDVAAIESQQERQTLMKKAVRYTFALPLTGVGPGQFMNAVWGDEHKKGEHPPALGTHNTYLEVSSECGLPAFFCYTFIVLGCIRLNYKRLKSLRQRPELDDVARLTYCLLAITCGFAVTIFFHHMTYTIYLPLLSGLTVCLSQIGPAAKPRVPSPV